jgi:hypothetical protein
LYLPHPLWISIKPPARWPVFRLVWTYSQRAGGNHFLDGHCLCHFVLQSGNGAIIALPLRYECRGHHDQSLIMAMGRDFTIPQYRSNGRRLNKNMDIQAFLHLLELEAPLTPVRLHRAYRRMVKRWHPDQFAHQPAIHALAEERLKAINQAYTLLKDYIKDQPVVQFDTKNNRDSVRSDSALASKPMGQSASHRPQQSANGAQTVYVSRRTQAPLGFAPPGGYQQSTSSKPSSPFERILRDIGQAEIPPANHQRAGARPLSRLGPGRRRRNGMRVEGFRSLSALQPVRPISKIEPIEGSD